MCCWSVQCWSDAQHTHPQVFMGFIQGFACASHLPHNAILSAGSGETHAVGMSCMIAEPHNCGQHGRQIETWVPEPVRQVVYT